MKWRPNPLELGLLLWAVVLCVALIWAAIPAHASDAKCRGRALQEAAGYFAFIGFDSVEAQRYAASVGQPHAVERAIQGFIKSRCGE
jgi:hypothetical protein